MARSLVMLSWLIAVFGEFSDLPEVIGVIGVIGEDGGGDGAVPGGVAPGDSYRNSIRTTDFSGGRCGPTEN